MFHLQTFEERLLSWSKFRTRLETSDTPLLALIEFYEGATLKSNKVDPWKIDSWPTAWELINQNRYCAFLLILGYYYSLKNTTRFENSDYSILILQDNTNGYITYRLRIGKNFLGYDKKILDELPENLHILHAYTKLELNK